MIRNNSNFVYVKVQGATGYLETQVMSLQAPHFIGRISKFTHTEQGQERHSAFTDRTNPKYVGKAKGYRVYAYITQCVDEFDELSPAAGNILQSVASEMATFYLNEHLSEKQKELYRD